MKRQGNANELELENDDNNNNEQKSGLRHNAQTQAPEPR